MAMNVEAEIRDLKRHVSELEGSFGFLPQQVKGVHKDLLGFQEKTEQRFETIDGRLDKIDCRLDKADGRLDHLEKDLRDLRQDMPGIVSSAMREVLRERRRDK
jgi:predicted RNase H-like nuclease (RuvC/YqgF family)